MVCEEKTLLISEYEAATNKFAAALTELQRKVGVSAKAEYDRLHRAADEARVKSEQARMALQRHVGGHRC